MISIFRPSLANSSAHGNATIYPAAAAHLAVTGHTDAAVDLGVIASTEAAAQCNQHQQLRESFKFYSVHVCVFLMLH